MDTGGSLMTNWKTAAHTEWHNGATVVLGRKLKKNGDTGERYNWLAGCGTIMDPFAFIRPIRWQGFPILGDALHVVVKTWRRVISSFAEV